MKLQKQSIRKIDISQINITENVRKDYDNIENLARSIEKYGQLQPVGVIEKEDGTFDMFYGFRRLNAFLFLINEGKDYNQIEAKITNGDPAIVQLVENIQRSDLKPFEFENALQVLIDSGMTQSEIAERLNIRLTRISDSLAAKKTRDSLATKNIDTSELSTSAVSALRSVPEEKQAEVISEVKEKGGTVKAVKEKVKEVVKNPECCTKEAICKNNSKCNICSFNVVNQQIDSESYHEMTVQEFLSLPVIKDYLQKERIRIVK